MRRDYNTGFGLSEQVEMLKYVDNNSAVGLTKMRVAHHHSHCGGRDA
jgi:hypothetical protein